MDWIKRRFSKRTITQPGNKLPERPADWNLTVSDLVAELRAGKRKSAGKAEWEWARQYERSLIPEGTRFPQKGDLYESKHDQTVQYMTHWCTAFTGGGKGMLLKGERIWIYHDAFEEDHGKPLGASALPVEYEQLESRMVPPSNRAHRNYDSFSLSFKTVDLNNDFTLIQTGFVGRRPRGHCSGL